MGRCGWFLGVAACAAVLTGCVDRRYVIESNPPGAVVYRNGQQIGATPVDDHFIYYGDYEFVLVKEGYETLKVKQHIPAPWYEWFPIDFFSENIWPHRTIDVRRFRYDMQPLPAVRTDVLIDEAQKLRNRGLAIVPRAEPPTEPVIGAPPPSGPVAGDPPPPVPVSATGPHP
jgi:hypothetical protein